MHLNSKLPVADMTLNAPQAKLLTVMANDSLALMSRGTGKTQGITAPWILHKVEMMPRSSGGLLCQSFADGEDKILRPLFEGFEMMGHVLNEHYMYGKKPPDSWHKPYTPILKYDHVLSFPNGTTCTLISLHQTGSANSYSFQWLVGPEAKFFNPEKLRSEVYPILRGNLKYFGNSAWYGAKFLETDKYGHDIQWLLERRKLVDHNVVTAVIYYQLKVNELRAKLVTVSNSHRYVIAKEVNRLNRILTALRKRLIYVGEGNAVDNVRNLSEDYIENMRSSLTEYEFKVAIMNEDPTKAEHTFYPDRTEANMFASDMCEVGDQPLAVALDYQYSISPLVWAQVNDLVIPGVKSLNFLGSMHVKYPYGLKHVIDKFCELYGTRPCKEVYYFFDHTAKGRRNMHSKYYEEVETYYRENGWTVNLIDMGLAPMHGTKYNRINGFLRGDIQDKYPIKIHKVECNPMVMSMDLAEAKTVPGEGTQKNKAPERDEKVAQEYAPHYSDTFDQIAWGVCEMDLYPSIDRVGTLLQWK